MNEKKYVILIEDGERARAFDEAARAISEIGLVARKRDTDRLVFSAKGNWFVIRGPWLSLHLARHVYFSKSGRPVDPPGWLVQAILSRACDLQVESVDTSKLPPQAAACR